MDRMGRRWKEPLACLSRSLIRASWKFAPLFLATLASAQTREPWTASRIHGSPEPLKPFVQQQAFPRLQPFNNALEMIAVPGMDRLTVIEAGGKIWTFENRDDAETAELMIDLKALHPELQHAYGIAFHPCWRDNREVFLCYAYGQNIDDGTKLSRFKLQSGSAASADPNSLPAQRGGAASAPPIIDPQSEELLLTWRSGGHNGACLRFGPDGMLYITTGDSEVPAPPDPLNTGQDNSDLLSAILRIDVDHRQPGLNYAIPKDNPWTGNARSAQSGSAARADQPTDRNSTHSAVVRPEIWAFGFRNPWKISFDPVNGHLWCGDVGWEMWEMIHLVKRGGNYGWSAMEASQPIKPELASPLAPISPPIVVHPHTEAASITGGFVYRGKQFPELAGAYVYGDYETGKIWALWHDGRQIVRHEEIADTPHRIVTFGEDAAGELFYIHYAIPSTIHRLVPNPHSGRPSDFPRRLSDTGLFADVKSQTRAAGVYPFAIRAPMWADGASAGRFIGMIGAADSVITKVWPNKNRNRIESKVTWPSEAVLAKTLSIESEPGNARSATRIETQVLHFDGETWNAYSYRWNEAGTDADLVPAGGGERKLELKGSRFPGGKHRSTWRFHSRAECLRCHNSWNQFVLGFHPQQLTEDSLRSLTALGLIDADYSKKSEARLVNPNDGALPVDARARSWLHANCAHCHRENGGGSVPLMVNAELPLSEMRAIGEKPFRGDFGIADASVIVPGNPWKSVLLHRIATSGSGHMPPVGASEVDETALGLFAKWIAGMSGEESVTHRSDQTDRIRSPESAMRTLIGRGGLPPAEFDKVVQAAAKSPDAHIRGLFERFLPDGQRIETLGPFATAEKIAAEKGDPNRGRELLLPTGKAAICLGCHFVNGQGRDFGPDLSKVGSRLNREQIMESFLKPGQTIPAPYAPVMIEMKDGSSQMGFVVSRSTDEIRLKLATAQTIVLRKSDIQSEKLLPGSLMPEGLLQSFTAQEAADLVEFLAGLK